MNNFIEAMAIVGFCASLGVVLFFGIFALDKIGSFIIKKKRYYRYKHRFDKPPIAKCYCYDCLRRDEEGRCSKFNWLVYETDFCYYADPRTEMDEVKKDC